MRSDLLLAQCFHRIDRCGLHRRSDCRNQCDERNDQDNDGQAHGIRRLAVEKETGQQSGRCECAREAAKYATGIVRVMPAGRRTQGRDNHHP